MISIKIHTDKGARLPEKATEHSACYDVRAYLPYDQEIILEKGDWFPVPTGLYFEIPPGYFISIRPRSGLANQYGITLLNSPATIDSDYRGELKIILINLGKNTFMIRHNERIAQIQLEKEIAIDWIPTPKEHFSPTTRNEGGLGSTGFA
ncbi:MAG: dUTP diphosphatase [Leptonema sp. (in: bacteria)]